MVWKIVPLNSPEGAGLPVASSEYSGGDRWLDAHFPDAMLVLQEIDGPQIEMRASATSRWRRAQAAAGSLFFVPAGDYNAFITGRPPGRELLLAVPQHFVAGSAATDDAWHQLDAPRLAFRDRALSRAIGALAQHERSRAPFGREYTQLLSSVIVERLLTAMHPSGSEMCRGRFSATVCRVVAEFIECSLGGPIDLERIAILAGVAKCELPARFRASFGISLHQYLIARRIERAKRRLLVSDTPLTALALELGFASHAHFSTMFRARTGVAPSLFREQSGTARALDVVTVDGLTPQLIAQVCLRTCGEVCLPDKDGQF